MQQFVAVTRRPGNRACSEPGIGMSASTDSIGHKDHLIGDGASCTGGDTGTNLGDNKNIKSKPKLEHGVALPNQTDSHWAGLYSNGDLLGHIENRLAICAKWITGKLFKYENLGGR